MKRALYIFIIAIILLVNADSALSQDLSIAISYLEGEKSKDSRSSEETFAITGNNVFYSVKYSGHKSKNEVDMEKVCEFTDGDLKKIRKTIEAKSLNVTDSLFQESSKSKSFEIYTNIVILLTVDFKGSKIRINGDTDEFKDIDLYENSVYFITMLRKMVKNCK